MSADERPKAEERDKPDGEVTLLLKRWMDGDEDAVNDVMPHVYGNLRELAGYYMNRERGDHTLSPTGLVNEMYLRLLGENLDGATVENRKHFFALAARCMRRILVEHARRYQAARRASPKDRVALSDDSDDFMWGYVQQSYEEILAIDQALGRLRKANPRQADVVELRYYVGLNEEEISDVLGISRSTVARAWRVARLFLSSTLSPELLRKKTEISETVWR